MKKRIFSMVLAVLMVASLAACGKTPEAESSVSSTTSESLPASETKTETDIPEDVTIKVFSNLPDRTNGQGLVEEIMFTKYQEENPHVTIEVEALDDEAYKTKFKAYAAGTDMPDLVSVWGQPAFIDEVIDAGILAELNIDDYKEYGFLEGSLNGFSKHGNLYGLPRTSDVMGFFYNEKMFEDNGWEVPQTYDELLALADTINATGMIPVSMDGADKWPLAIYYNDILVKLHGEGIMDFQVSAIEAKDWSAPELLEAAQILQETAQAGLFQTGFETSDYGTSMNLFANGQAAMFYMGSWETSMANNEDVIPEVRENINVFTMPVIDGGKGTAKDISAWNGGGHSITANSKVKEEAIQLLNAMYEPDGWSRVAWENNVCMSAQNFSQYKTGEETPVQLEFIDILTGSNSISGTPTNDLGTSDYKTRSEDLMQELAISAITPEEFIQKMAEAS